jgi:hypothetical protein
MFLCHGECGNEKSFDKPCLCGVCISIMEKASGKGCLDGLERCKSRFGFEMLIEEKVQFT